ncbi:MAG: hypothetical protein AAFO01_11275 [Pseudomonadota bacterium]
MESLTSEAALWWAVILSGFYHGINPGMGWPLAVSAALMEQKATALPRALGAMAFGHFLAMMAILLPFTAMIQLVFWEREIRIAAALLVALVGLYLLINPRHPKILARIKPTRLALWSFVAAMAHGAGLMLVPIFMGICGLDQADAGHQAAGALMRDNIETALIVAAAHTLAMVVAGGLMATVIYLWLGLKFLSKTWFNLDRAWALSLICVGIFGITATYTGH